MRNHIRLVYSAIVMLLSLLSIRAQDIDKMPNEVGISVGYSWPTSATLKSPWPPYETVFRFRSEGIAGLYYSRCFANQWQWRLSTSYTCYKGIRENWDTGSYHHSIPIYSFSNAFLFCTRQQSKLTPYFGISLDLLRTENDDLKRFKVNLPEAEVVTPSSNWNIGGSLLFGVQYDAAKAMRLRMELQCQYGAITMNRWEWHGLKVGKYEKEGKKNIAINPINITFSISYRW